MWPFRRPSVPQHPESPVLVHLVANGADLTEPRHWRHFLYFPDPVSAERAADSVRSARWEVESGGPVEMDGTWLVTAGQHGVVVDDAVLQRARALFEELVAITPGAEWDGWEASV
jgi:hypothetical protein